MKLYEVRRFNSENEKWATEYVKEYTKEAYTKKYRYTPEVLKLDDGRTKYTLCIKAKQVATACKYLMVYFGEEIQSLSSIVADILANDPKTKNHTEYTVHGDGYTCYVYVGDDAGNTHISLYLDAEASEESNPEETETETQNEANEETKEETKMNSTSKKKLDRTAAIKTIFYHLACGGYSDLPRATELYRYLSCDGEIGLTREGIKRYMLENALCDDDAFDYSNEEIADEWFRFADEDEDEEETEIARETKDESVGEGVAFKSEIEETQSGDDVHETNARLEVVKLKDARFGTPHLYKSVTGYAFYDAKKGGYWAYSADRDKHGILAPYTPCGGREALEKILSDGGFTSFEGMEIVKPL